MRHALVTVALVALPVVTVAGVSLAKDKAPETRLAVLEFDGGGLAPDVLAALSDEARAGALAAVKGKDVLVMTRESMSAIASDMGKCVGEGNCEVETARNIGAHLVVTGTVAKVGKKLTLSLKLLDAKSGALLATSSVEGKDAVALKRSVKDATSTLLAEGLASGGTGGTQDLPPPPAALTGPSSARLAKPVVIVYGDQFPTEPVVFTKQDGKPTSQSSLVPAAALKSYALGVARRHFEDASFTKPKAKKGERVRELVIQSVTIVQNPGPSYQARVVVDRVQDGKRLGQATGQGFAMPDRSQQRAAASFAPGVFGLVAAQKAGQANAEKDAATIEIAVVQALDSACLQLAAYWSGEQMVEEMNAKNRR